MSIFKNYLEEYREQTRTVSMLTAELLASGTDGAALTDSSETVRQIDEALTQASELVKQMELEARSQRSPERRKDWSNRCKGYKATVANLKTEFEAARRQHEREMLFDRTGAFHDPEDQFNEDDRARLLNTNDALNRQGSNIKRSLEALAETEMVGMEITQELARGREKIESVQIRIGQVDSMANTARQALRSMNQREVQHKLVLWGVIGLLVVGSAVATYYAFK